MTAPALLRSVYRVVAPYAFLAPALLAIGVFFVLPVIAAFLLGFTDFDIYAVADLANLRWIGLRNYVQLVRDPAFHTALRNTLYFVLLGGPLSIALSLVIALLVHHRLVRCKSLFRTVFLLPVVCTLVAVAVVWRYLYQPRDGLLNLALAAFGFGPVDWLGDPRWAMPAIILMALWKNFGFNMLIFLAALQRVPESVYEAARLDGAGAWQELRHVTVPMLRPTLQFVAVITLAGYFQLFAEPYVMTGGGPADSTLSVVLLMYREGFRWWNMGYAAAVSFVLFALILAATRLVLGRGAMASTAAGGSR
jgi:multiple sugar transport system permease protein